MDAGTINYIDQCKRSIEDARNQIAQDAGEACIKVLASLGFELTSIQRQDLFDLMQRLN